MTAREANGRRSRPYHRGMKKPITDKELNAANVRVLHAIRLNSAADNYRLDVLCMRRCLRDYPKDSQTYKTLLANFVKTLLDKYAVFIDEMTEGLPENDIEIFADLSGEEYDPE